MKPCGRHSGVEILDDDAGPGTISFRASSRSTGNLPIPHNFTKAARASGLPRSTRLRRERNVVFVQRNQRLPADEASGW